MNPIRQRLISLRSRARDLQAGLRQWAAYADVLDGQTKEKLLERWTPGQREDFDADAEPLRRRLRPVQVHVEMLGTWYDYVLETIETEIDRARALLDQGRNHECIAILADVEQRLIDPNRDTLSFVTASFMQRTAPTTTHRIAALDAIIRALYLPTIRNAHKRGLLTKESLSRSPLATLCGGDAGCTWRQHVLTSAAEGRFIPVSLVSVPQQLTAEPWNLVGIAHDVGLQVYSDCDLAWEMAHKLQREAQLTGVSAITAPVWARWHETLFADTFGVLQLGPAYVSGMIETLGGNPATILATTPTGDAPPAYIRWHVMLQTLQLLSYADEARERFNQIHVLCGDPNQLTQQYGPIWTQLINEARSIAGLVAFSPLQKLGGARVIDVVPPFLSNEFQNAVKVKDLLAGGDETCTEDAQFTWCASVRDVPAHLVLAGLRLAFEAFPQQDTAARLRTRFGCLMQYLTRETSPTREREDREFAPGNETLRSIARRATPAMA